MMHSCNPRISCTLAREAHTWAAERTRGGSNRNGAQSLRERGAHGVRPVLQARQAQRLDGLKSRQAGGPEVGAAAGAQGAQHAGAGQPRLHSQVALAQQPLDAAVDVSLHGLGVAVAAAHALDRRGQHVHCRVRGALAQVPAGRPKRDGTRTCGDGGRAEELRCLKRRAMS